MKFVAIKSFSYNTRRLQAGDVFETKTDRDGKILAAIKNARPLEDRPEEKLAAPKKEVLNKYADKHKVEKMTDEKKTDSPILDAANQALEGKEHNRVILEDKPAPEIEKVDAVEGKEPKNKEDVTTTKQPEEAAKEAVKEGNKDETKSTPKPRAKPATEK